MGIRAVKLKSNILVFLSHFVKRYNRPIKGISAVYNQRYAKGSGRQHKLDIMRKEGLSGAPCVLYMHGGGWSAFDKDVFRSTCKRLAECGTLVFNCNFRLAPKYGIEHMLEDANEAFRYINSNAEKFGGDTDRNILAGDSAGAHILSQYINEAIRDGKEDIVNRVKGCVFFYGVYNLDTVRFTCFKGMKEYLDALISPKTTDYEKVLEKYSPVHLVNEKHPPAFICCGEVDVLTQTQTKEYITALEEKGVKVEKLISPAECKDAAHRFITYDDNPASVKAFQAFKEFIKEI